MLLPVIIVAKNLYLVNNRKSAHPVMNAINVATRFFALNRPGDVAAALKADVFDGTFEMKDLTLLLLLLTCLKPCDDDTRTWFVLMERCGGKLAGEKATAVDAKKRYGSADFMVVELARAQYRLYVSCKLLWLRYVPVALRLIVCYVLG